MSTPFELLPDALAWLDLHCPLVPYGAERRRRVAALANQICLADGRKHVCRNDMEAADAQLREAAA